MTRTAATAMLMIQRIQSMPRRLNTDRCGEVEADEHATDPADDGKPERNVVGPPARRTCPAGR